MKKFFRNNGLSITFFLLFLFSLGGQAVTGFNEHNQEVLESGTETGLQYLGNPRFWFESFQNWQSEFLSIFSIIVLSIFLREQYSPQSKPVDAPDSETGG